MFISRVHVLSELLKTVLEMCKCISYAFLFIVPPLWYFLGFNFHCRMPMDTTPVRFVGLYYGSCHSHHFSSASPIGWAATLHSEDGASLTLNVCSDCALPKVAQINYILEVTPTPYLL